MVQHRKELYKLGDYKEQGHNRNLGGYNVIFSRSVLWLTYTRTLRSGEAPDPKAPWPRT